MSHYAILDGQNVTNVALADDPSFAQAQGWVACPDHVGPGYTYDGTTWAAPAPLPPGPHVVAQAAFVSTLSGIDTSAITDPAAKTAIETLIASLTGTGSASTIVHVHPGH